MDTKAAAALLDQSQYRSEGSRELFETMKDFGLVAVFGASDDLMEFRGAIYGELDAYEGTIAYLNARGLLTNDCDNDDCPHFKALNKTATTIVALWDQGDELSWQYLTDIPHETFMVFEDEEPYCRGIVFALADVPN